MNIPSELKYTSDHEWLKDLGNDEVLVGITEHAQDQLGDVVYVDLPKVGSEIKKGATFGTVESVKAVSDLYAPVSGVVSEVNADLSSKPESVNSDPYGKAWMVKIKLSDKSELDALLSHDAYAQML